MFEFTHNGTHQDQRNYQTLMQRKIHGPAIIRFAILGLLIPYGAAALAASLGRTYLIFMIPGQYLSYGGALAFALFSIATYWIFRDVGFVLWRWFITPSVALPDQEVLIDDDGVLTTSRTGVEFINWRGIIEVITSRYGLVLRNGPDGGVFLPNRVFEDQSQKQALIEFVEERITA